MPYAYGFEVYEAAVEQKQEELLWEVWLARYPHMTQENYVSFEQFKIDVKAEPVVERSEKEVLADADRILNSMGAN